MEFHSSFPHIVITTFSHLIMLRLCSKNIIWFGHLQNPLTDTGEKWVKKKCCIRSPSIYFCSCSCLVLLILSSTSYCVLLSVASSALNMHKLSRLGEKRVYKSVGAFFIYIWLFTSWWLNHGQFNHSDFSIWSQQLFIMFCFFLNQLFSEVKTAIQNNW